MEIEEMNKPCPFCDADVVPFGDGIDRASGLVTKQIQHPFLDNGCPLAILVFKADRWNERPLIESLLAERTEQCAKIAEDRISFIHQKEKEVKETAPVFDDEGLHVKTYAEAAKYEAAFIAKEIRALNQENKS